MTIESLTVLALLSLAAWLYLYRWHHGFWRADQRLPESDAALSAWPAVTAVVPARNEADVVGAAVASLVRQDYPGRLSVVVVDDRSDDGTADAARAAGGAGSAPLTVIDGRALAAGWTGKLWAVSQGLAALDDAARYVWLTDADVRHAPDTLRRLVAKAETEHRHLVSLMVRLHCRSPIERLLIPAFVYFFQKLYPFPAVNDPGRREAGAAGGCMLVRRDSLEASGGVAAIRGALIDDCALAARIKQRGPVWLGLTGESESLRPYPGLGAIWRMVARTAFTQLRYRGDLLAGTVLGMAVVYLGPPAAAVWGLANGAPATALCGLVALGLMYRTYWPTWRLYRGPGIGLLLLPAAATLYCLMTVDSALRHWRGRGGGWKGRTYPEGGSHPDKECTVEFPRRPR